MSAPIIMTLEQRNNMLSIMADQHKELIGQADKEPIMATVTCSCGRKRGINRAVRCLYCDIWYCELCAEIHFGQTRAEHKGRVQIQEGE